MALMPPKTHSLSPAAPQQPGREPAKLMFPAAPRHVVRIATCRATRVHENRWRDKALRALQAVVRLAQHHRPHAGSTRAPYPEVPEHVRSLPYFPCGWVGA